MMARKAYILVFAMGLAVAAAAQTESWQLDPAHSAAQFAVRHMGISTVRGNFTKLNGTVQYDPSDPSKSSIDATLDAGSVDTRVEMRDNDLRSPKFFDAAKFPTITFKSKRVEPAGAGKLKVTGDLTMHGVTKEIVLDVEGPSEPIKDPRGNSHMGASATATLNRRDFGVGAIPAAMVSESIAITLDLELVRQGATKQ